MAKTVGILTVHGGYNFGAVLQAFALQRTISGLGHSCSIIDYREPKPDSDYRLFHVPRNRGSIKHDILMMLNLRSHLMSRKRYERFRSAYLSLTAQSYRSVEDILRGGLRFDAYVSGSDQIWHPYLLDRPCGPIFFQNFVSSGRRVAYAPSFGFSEIPSQYRDRAAESIRRFDFLSAREDTGCAIIRDLTGRSAELALDPTLLQASAEYDKVAVEPSLDKPYILLYPMQLSDRLRELALKVRTCLKLPIVAVLPAFFEPWRFSFADKLIYDAGPAEFLGWMKCAAFVCTNSFHGTCFSIIYRKNFLGVPHSGYNTRSYSLLSRLGLSARQLAEPERLGPDNPLLAPPDYSSVEPHLQQAIEQSLGYLQRALA